MKDTRRGMTGDSPAARPAAKGTGRLSGQMSLAPELSARELEVLATLTDEQKLAVAHAIRLACIEVRRFERSVIAEQEQQ